MEYDILDKFRAPEEYVKQLGNHGRPFITVPRHQFYCQDAIVREIEKLCGEEMKKKFLENL